MIRRVLIAPRAQRELRKVPAYIRDKLETWAQAVREIGLESVKKIPGYHDEPLKGDRRGQRSIRLSRSYRAIYILIAEGVIEFVSVEEVHKHEY